MNVMFLKGTQAEYDAATKSAYTFYYTEDTHRLYLGEVLLASQMAAIGTIDSTFTGKQATITSNFTPAGTISEIVHTPAGSVTVAAAAPQSGETANYTPAGEISKPGISVDPETVVVKSVTMEKILIGSKYFFSCYDDFVAKDIDEIQIIETTDFKQIKQITGQGRCLFLMKKHSSKDEYIDWALKSSIGMVIGKFLVPEFCKQIGFTIEDLPRLQPLIDKLDEKHLYEKIIFDSYIENHAFELTIEQRDRAYSMYRESRAAA